MILIIFHQYFFHILYSFKVKIANTKYPLEEIEIHAFYCFQQDVIFTNCKTPLMGADSIFRTIKTVLKSPTFLILIEKNDLKKNSRKTIIFFVQKIIVHENFDVEYQDRFG